MRTTLDPGLQKIARKTLVDGLVAYDHRHGWRGVVKNVSLEGDWGKTLAAVNVWPDIDPWRLAVVLEASKDTAKIGLRPTRTSTGALSKERETGTIPFDEVKWARPKLKNGMGGSPRVLTDVLKPGDVIYVSPREPTDKEPDVTGQWSLEQVPAVGGAIVAMDPHTGRVLALVGGFSFAESQFDRAVQARRQPGSSFKPIIYSTALDNGYTPASIIVDGPLCISQGAGMPQWCPKNYEAGSAAGPSTLRFGIEHSRNLMTVRLSNDMGMPIIVEYARRFGVYDNLMPMLVDGARRRRNHAAAHGRRLRHHRQWRQADKADADRPYPGSLRPHHLAARRPRVPRLRGKRMVRPARAATRRRPPADHRSDDVLSDDLTSWKASSSAARR